MEQLTLEEKAHKYVTENKTDATATKARKPSYPYVYAQFFIQESNIFGKPSSSKPRILTQFYRQAAADNNMKERDMINLLADSYLELHNMHM